MIEWKFRKDGNDFEPMKTILKIVNYLMTFFFLALRFPFESSIFNGRIGADIIRRLAWNCARLAFTDKRLELPSAVVVALFGATLDGDGVLLVICQQKKKKRKSKRKYFICP